MLKRANQMPKQRHSKRGKKKSKSFSLSHYLSSQPGYCPILKLREIERCIICHWLDLRSIARLLCTSKLFSSIGHNAVIWNTVLSHNSVRLNSSAVLPSFLSAPASIGNAMIKMHINEAEFTAELFSHLIHLPRLDHLTFPLMSWLVDAFQERSEEMEQTMQHLCTCLRSVSLLVTHPDTNQRDISWLRLLESLLSRFCHSNVKRLCLSGSEPIWTEVSLPSMEELSIGFPVMAPVTLGSHYNVLRITHQACRCGFTMFYLTRALSQPHVHVHTLIVPGKGLELGGGPLTTIPHIIPVLKILHQQANKDYVYDLLRHLPHVLRLELESAKLIDMVMGLLREYNVSLSPDLQQILLINGTAYQQQKYQHKLNTICNHTKRTRQPIELMLDSSG